MKRLYILSIIFLISSCINAFTYYVPADFSSIQNALNACSPGDTVIVSAGTYYENINWPETENIFLVSELGPTVTIIDGRYPSDPDSASVIAFSEIDTATVMGFTIKNGAGTLDWVWGLSGGGIFCYESSPQIIDNVIDSNFAFYGAAISCLKFSSPVISGNTITNNTAIEGSGGIDCYDNCSPEIVNNSIVNNYADWGGGISCQFHCSPHIEGNTIIGNHGITNGGGIFIIEYSAPRIIKNIISNNYGHGIRSSSNTQKPIIKLCTIEENYGDGIRCNSSSPIIDSCIIKNNTANQIHAYGDAIPRLHQNDILSNNAYFGVYNETAGIEIEADSNYWGHSSGPYHPILNPFGSGSKVSDWVFFMPWEPEPIIVEVKEEFLASTPSEFVLYQNYPNPFNPQTRIQYSIAEISYIEITLYDILGNEVETLVEGEKPVGIHKVLFNAANLSSGIYFYEMLVRNSATKSEKIYVETKKMIILK